MQIFTPPPTKKVTKNKHTQQQYTNSHNILTSQTHITPLLSDMTFDVENELESNFLDELRRELCAPEDEQASSGARKRPISDMNDDDFYDLSKDISESNKRPMQQKTQQIDKGCSYVMEQTFVEEAKEMRKESSPSPPKLSADDSSNNRFNAADLNDGRANVNTKSPLTLFNEISERVYQTADENIKRGRNPIDDLAMGISSDFDYPTTVSIGSNALDTFVRNAHQSNENDTGIDKEESKWDSNWRMKFGELRNYKEAHGDYMVPKRHPTLGIWVNSQRAYYRLLKEGKKASITQERIDLLNSIGFEWSTYKVLPWMDRFELLRNYKEAHGDCLVSHRHPTLGIWVNSQRAYYRLLKEGKKASITQERIDLLNSIGFEWSPSKVLPWMDRFEALRNYKEAHGDCLVSSRHPGLGIWVTTQRRNYRLLKEGKKSRITQERIDLLNSIGFEWSVNKVLSWTDRFELLRNYKEAHGDCLVPQRQSTLGIWVHHQRGYYRHFKEGKKSRITQERIDLLSSIGFEWSVYHRG